MRKFRISLIFLFLILYFSASLAAQQKTIKELKREFKKSKDPLEKAYKSFEIAELLNARQDTLSKDWYLTTIDLHKTAPCDKSQIIRFRLIYNIAISYFKLTDFQKSEVWFEKAAISLNKKQFSQHEKLQFRTEIELYMEKINNATN